MIGSTGPNGRETRSLRNAFRRTDILYKIRIFEKEANNYALSSEVFLEKKTRKIIGFHRFSEPVSVYIDKNELLTARKDVLSRGIIYTIDDIPCCIRQLYKKAEKELNYDRC